MFQGFTKGVLVASAIATGAAFGLQANVARALDPFIGQIQYHGFNFPPRGWAHCNGQLLQVSSFSALFSLLGTTFGGDGRTTFGLPDMRGRVPIHPGTGPGLSPYSWGQKGGTERVTLNVANLPSHNHTATLNGSSAAATSATPGSNLPANLGRVRAYGSGAPDVTMNAAAISVGNTGGGQSFRIVQPFLGVYCSIALQGVFPSRN